MFAVDVCGTLWILDNRHGMADQTTCHMESNSVAFTPSGKGQVTDMTRSEVDGRDARSPAHEANDLPPGRRGCERGIFTQ